MGGRNDDGGWGLLPCDGDSRLYYTAWASHAVGSIIEPAPTTAFILSRHEPGSGFADAGPAQVFETAVALWSLGLLGADPVAVAPTAVAFLEAAQQPNGGFAEDPFVTAWAMQALLGLLPPLTPVIDSNGGAGVGEDFITDEGRVHISGVAPMGATAIDIAGAVDDLLFDPATGHYSFYVDLAAGLNTLVVRARSRSGLAGVPRSLAVTRDPTLSAQTIDLVPGLNAVGLTLAPANPLGTRGLLDLLGPAVQSVERLDAASGRYVRVQRGPTGGMTGPDFPLAGLMAVHLVATGPATARLVGAPVVPATVDLHPGVNAITLPSPPPGLHARDLLSALGGPDVAPALQRYVREQGRIETLGYTAGTLVGVDFPLVAGEVYYPHLRQALPGFVLPGRVAPTIRIAAPLPDAVITTSPVTVSGLVSGDGELSVAVNGSPALLSDGVFSAAVPLLASGLVTLTATVQDDIGQRAADAVTVSFAPADHVLQIGSSVGGEGVFQADPAILPGIAFYTETLLAVPVGLSYQTESLGIDGSGRVTVHWRITATPGATPGLHAVEVE